MSEPEVVEFSDIEASKENIQPLKKGRNAVQLVSILKETADQIKLERDELEKNIQSHEGSDPIAPWLDYIVWTRQKFPSGGEQAHLVPLLEKVTKMFKEDPRYLQDLRYLKVWVMYAESVPDPDEIFTFMKANNIGTSHALFFEAWSLFLEGKGKYVNADKVLNYGIRKGAQPVETLQSALLRFQHRSVVRIQKNVQEQQSTPFLEEAKAERRGPLSDLSPSTYGSQSLNHASLRPLPSSTAVILPSTRRPSTTNNSLSSTLKSNKNNFKVFVESRESMSESHGLPSLPGSTRPVSSTASLSPQSSLPLPLHTTAPAPAPTDPFEWKVLRPEKSRNKENIGEITSWKEPLTSYTTAVAIATSSTSTSTTPTSSRLSGRPSITVFVDEDCQGGSSVFDPFDRSVPTRKMLRNGDILGKRKAMEALRPVHITRRDNPLKELPG